MSLEYKTAPLHVKILCFIVLAATGGPALMLIWLLIMLYPLVPMNTAFFGGLLLGIFGFCWYAYRTIRFMRGGSL